MEGGVEFYAMIWYVSCLKARNLISIGSIHLMVRVRDVDSETSSLESVLIVNDFQKNFLMIWSVILH